MRQAGPSPVQRLVFRPKATARLTRRLGGWRPSDISESSRPKGRGQLTQNDDLERTWTEIQTCLRGSFPETVYQTWFAELRPLRIEGAVIYVSAPSRVREWVARRFGVALSAAAADTVPELRRLELIDEQARAAGRDNHQQPSLLERSRLTYSFETFVIGPENRFAHAAALAVAEMPAQAYNPLFLHGPPGVGKTHLLQAIGTYTAAHSPGMSVHYSTVESFTSNFIQALRHGHVEAFKKTYRQTDLLLLDDAQFLDGKTKTAEEFFHTLDTAIASGCQVAITADKPPSAMPMLESRLRERLQAGLLVDLNPPDFQTRLTILNRLATKDPALRKAGSEEILERIAQRITTNVRALRGALTRLTAYSSLTGTSITLPIVDDVLTHLYDPASGFRNTLPCQPWTGSRQPSPKHSLSSRRSSYPPGATAASFMLARSRCTSAAS